MPIRDDGSDDLTETACNQHPCTDCYEEQRPPLAYVFAEVHQTKAVHQKEDAERNYQATEKHPRTHAPGPAYAWNHYHCLRPLLSHSNTETSAVPMRYDACQ